ncbi:helix-turn-helix transcriptional regulator [Kribbella swartbergensis]
MAAINRELADFLRRARSQVDPSRAGLPPDARVRRVPGLRREEVALLAGVSTDYYTRLEQGRRIMPSAAVVAAIGRALGLDTAGTAHLEDLIRLTMAPDREPPEGRRVRPGLYQLLDVLDGQPALVLGRRTDVLAANHMAKALFTDFDRLPSVQRNYARWLFFEEAARSLFVDWEIQARAVVESLRFNAGRYPRDQRTIDLVTGLREHSQEFDQWWRQHRVQESTYGSKRLRHPLVGELTVEFEALALPGDSDMTLFLYSTKAGSSSRQAMNLLASWRHPAEPPTLPTATSVPASSGASEGN